MLDWVKLRRASVTATKCKKYGRGLGMGGATTPNQLQPVSKDVEVKGRLDLTPRLQQSKSRRVPLPLCRPFKPHLPIPGQFNIPSFCLSIVRKFTAKTVKDSLIAPSSGHLPFSSAALKGLFACLWSTAQSVITKLVVFSAT